MISLIDEAKRKCEEISSEKGKCGLPIKREDAISILMSFDQDNQDKNHYLMSEAIMRGLAKNFGEDEDYWGMLGLLHDVDWALTKNDIKNHLTIAPKILREKGFSEDFVEIIVSHGYGFDCADLKDKVRSRKIEHSLAASETITGIIYAYALMRGGKVDDMEVKGLKKKFKDKAFAAGCNREIIKEIEKTGINLEEFFRISIDSVRDIKEIIGLN
jgi:uncharacterized protein